MRVGKVVLLFSGLLLVAVIAACTYVARQRREPTSLPASPRPVVAAPSPRPLPRLEIGLPTANSFLFTPGGESRFYQPIEESRPNSGKYGCVRIGRSGEDGSGFHEGIDIRSLQRDRRGDPTDPVMAIADGVVVYVNPIAGNSNYGIYIVVKHQWHEAELYSIYAHLSSVSAGIQRGVSVARGQQLGVLGRTSNEFAGGLMPKERGHLHLEICVMANPNYAAWAQRKNKRPIEHGVFNGGNFLGLDPAAFLIAAQNDPQFSVRKFLQSQTRAFTVLFSGFTRGMTQPPEFLKYHPWLLTETAAMKDSTLYAYEVRFDHTGFPLEAVARAYSELSEGQRDALAQSSWILSGVNEAELARNNCRGLVRKDGNRWVLTGRGSELMEILTFTP